MKHIKLTKGTPFKLEESHFSHATDGRQAEQRTEVTLLATDHHLLVDFMCHDNPHVHANDLTEHNADLYNQEVFELFIAPSEADPEHYLEVELNPNNALWVGHVHNPSLGEGGGNSLQMVEYAEAAIRHGVTVSEDSWQGFFEIPWQLIGEPTAAYRINFYRIVATQPPTVPNWTGNPDTCDYLCWSATMSGTEPAFHRPKKFGLLEIA